MKLVHLSASCRRSLVAGSSLIALAVSAPSLAVADHAAKVEDLQKQVDELKSEVESLRGDMEDQATKVDERILGPRAAQSGSDTVSLAISGQLNRGVLIAGDGERTDAFFVDNDNSSTRIRLIGDAKFNDDISAGSIIEVQFESNSTAAVSQDNERNVGPNNFTERKLEVFFDSKTYGRLWIGQGDTASNNTTEVDLSGVSVVGYSGIQDLAGGLQFVDDDGDLSGVTIGDTFNNFDGLSRDDRVRYDTPRFHGAKLSGSVIADNRWDLAGYYSRELLGAHKFEAAIAYADVDESFEQLSGSASVLLGDVVPGANFTFAAGTRNFDEGGRNDGHFVYAKLGYLFSPFAFGKTGVAVDYYYGDDVDADGDDSQSFGLLAVQNVDKIGTELYAGFRNHDLDRVGEDFSDINALLVGVRLKF